MPVRAEGGMRLVDDTHADGQICPVCRGTQSEAPALAPPLGKQQQLADFIYPTRLRLASLPAGGRVSE
jgi:hypothetical protein